MRIFKITRAAPVVVNTDVDRAVRTQTEFNMRSIRYLLLMITAMFVVIGILMIVLGISVYSYYHSFSTFYESGMIRMTPSILSVFIGVVLLIISIFGFFGSLKLSTCMVNLYAFVLMLLLIIKLVVVILAFTSVGDNILWYYIDIPVNMYSDPEIQLEIDSLQRHFGCCGSNSYMDYLDVVFAPNQPVLQAIIPHGDEFLKMTLPESCCSIVDGYCDAVPVTGCKYALYNSLVNNSMVIGILGICMMLMNILGIIFALLLARCIRKLKSTRGLLAWRIRESVIVARQAEEKQQSEVEANQVHIEPQTSSAA